MTTISHEGSVVDVCDTATTAVAIASEVDEDGHAHRVRLSELETKTMKVGDTREPNGEAYDSGFSEEGMTRCVAARSASVCCINMPYGCIRNKKVRPSLLGVIKRRPTMCNN